MKQLIRFTKNKLFFISKFAKNNACNLNYIHTTVFFIYIDMNYPVRNI